ncbi:MAG: polysaccharide deacetylase family protein [gamma proteobacterium symbiont of Bathyaustriella thionipta]|nr:polysaccharide deacetylase family protein [gamma proteobacterium symbiont of Bathyaustriella thionipta]MCU7948701.1 polysaccharide deacetylase family protein [gamma proteobacterium symbiont of Bathyaustriella thionipta]MCU7953878.1 polysaccharide deacetylase family protein [gamma proteobacterium symbiont of Bathyaustriella thionipta]MCU7955026.1 polysaccharide deacetylase family protein [gamma proteobacterium symbiont of Bathyaustriella thionipta]MCU7968640.1 polysaccharide deacetylase famil
MTIINIHVPSQCPKERTWIMQTLLDEFLGINFNIIKEIRNDIKFTYENKDLLINDSFFQKADAQWLHSSTLPEQPLTVWNQESISLNIKLIKSDLPVIYGVPDCKIHKNSIDLGIDIFGSAFFMLSRYEEVIKNDHDKHNRFPLTASLAYQENFHDRPIINEYLEILWACMKFIWPGLKRKKRESRTLISCDVDVPYSPAIKSIPKLIRQLGVDLLVYKSLSLALKQILNYWLAKKGDFRFDSNYVFDWMMDCCESNHIKCAFFFISDHSGGKIDGCYHLNETIIRNILNKVHKRGHEIGLHTSYETYLSKKQISKEFKILQKVCADENIYQENWGGRQHFLRWDASKTFNYWNEAGLTYDSTLYYAEQPGFRSGICYEYHTYDLLERKMLNLRERPLIVMECSIIYSYYMNLGFTQEALNYVLYFKNTCREYNGDFTLLWHNSQFAKKQARDFYKKILEA